MIAGIDKVLLSPRVRPELSGLLRFATEFLYFGVKEARACLFAGLFFLSVFVVPRGGVLGLPRYDVILFVALMIQAWMLAAKLETWDEVKAISLFHVLGFALEAFKTSSAIGSWGLPGFCLHQIVGRPLVLRVYVCRRRQLHHSGLAIICSEDQASSAILDGGDGGDTDLRQLLYTSFYR
jgi:hypothetical protein